MKLKPATLKDDLHGYNIHEALMYFENDLLVKGFMSNDRDYTIELITGNGFIKSNIIEYCHLQNIACREKLGNSGVLIIHPNRDYAEN